MYACVLIYLYFCQFITISLTLICWLFQKVRNGVDVHTFFQIKVICATYNVGTRKTRPDTWLPQEQEHFQSQTIDNWELTESWTKPSWNLWVSCKKCWIRAFSTSDYFAQSRDCRKKIDWQYYYFFGQRRVSIQSAPCNGIRQPKSAYGHKNAVHDPYNTCKDYRL